jgi:hypothetical protein
MRGASQFVRPKRGESSLTRMTASLVLAIVSVLLASPASAQINGIPPSVTSIGRGPHLPNPAPSVTSLGPYGYGQRPHGYQPYFNGNYRRRGYGYSGTGLAYSAPYYYIPMDSYGYDYVGGPDLYSGPPIGPNEPTLHIVVEQPPARLYSRDPDEPQASTALPGPRMQEREPSVADTKPSEPTVLVFRDGHQQEVMNYAIMGQMVYVFDKRTQKIALADLDVAATVKANDVRGLDFNIPAQKPAQKKNSDLQPKSAPVESKPAPSDIASL